MLSTCGVRVETFAALEVQMERFARRSINHAVSGTANEKNTAASLILARGGFEASLRHMYAFVVGKPAYRPTWLETYNRGSPRLRIYK